MNALGLLRDSVLQLKAYAPEEAEGDVALDANENPYAPPPEFLARAQELLKGISLNRYPDPSCAALLKAASKYYALPPDHLLAGNGSDEFIASLFVAFGGPGRRCLLASPSFSMYALCARAAGWEVLEEPLGPHWELTQAFVERAKRESPQLVILASPNNPTGNRFDDGGVDALLGLGSVVVLDEAYAEFASKQRTGEVRQRENLIVLRTLSKAFGLAGLRLGFLAARPELVGELNKLRLPYNIDALAQELGRAALDMAPAFSEALRLVKGDTPRLEAGLRSVAGMEVFPSDANFFLVRYSQASALHRHFLDRGLRLRRFSGGALENCLRISVGTGSEVDRCLLALKEWKG